MRGKLRVSNISIEDKKITIIARKFSIDLTKKTDAVTITTEVSEVDAGMYETGWITFDGYVEVNIGIISRLLGESAEYGDAVVTQDSLTYSFEPVTNVVTVGGGIIKATGFTPYNNIITVNAGTIKSTGVVTYYSVVTIGGGIIKSTGVTV